jgi:hypothetical protein
VEVSGKLLLMEFAGEIVVTSGTLFTERESARYSVRNSRVSHRFGFRPDIKDLYAAKVPGEMQDLCDQFRTLAACLA